MGMYESGELDAVMDNFEKSIDFENIYVGGNMEREEKIEIEKDGRYVYRYRNKNYYSNGNVNNMFIMFLHGYVAGKLAERG